MNPIMHWIAGHVTETMIIVGVLVAILWRWRYIAIGGAILAFTLVGYVTQFATMNERADQSDAAYVSCLQRELCAARSPGCNACNSVPAADREKCLVIEVNKLTNKNNEILGKCYGGNRGNKLWDTLDNILDALKP